MLPVRIGKLPAALDYLLRPFQVLRSGRNVAKRDLDKLRAAIGELLGAQAGTGARTISGDNRVVAFGESSPR